MLCLMRELVVPRAVNADCFTVSSRSGDGPSGSHKAWLGGGSNSQRTGFVTAVDLDTNTVATQVLTALCASGCDYRLLNQNQIIPRNLYISPSVLFIVVKVLSNCWYQFDCILSLFHFVMFGQCKYEELLDDSWLDNFLTSFPVKPPSVLSKRIKQKHFCMPLSDI